MSSNSITIPADTHSQLHHHQHTSYTPSLSNAIPQKIDLSSSSSTASSSSPPPPESIHAGAMSFEDLLKVYATKQDAEQKSMSPSPSPPQHTTTTTTGEANAGSFASFRNIPLSPSFSTNRHPSMIVSHSSPGKTRHLKKRKIIQFSRCCPDSIL